MRVVIGATGNVGTTVLRALAPRSGTRSPLVNASRARALLGWVPTRTSLEILLELLRGIRDGAGLATPPARATLQGSGVDPCGTHPGWSTER